jgi:hypothetical protein
MEITRLRRTLAISGLMAALSFGSFSRLPGNENIRTVQIVTLLACGIALGVFLVTAFSLFRERKK